MIWSDMSGGKPLYVCKICYRYYSHIIHTYPTVYRLFSCVMKTGTIYSVYILSLRRRTVMNVVRISGQPLFSPHTVNGGGCSAFVFCSES